MYSVELPCYQEEQSSRNSTPATVPHHDVLTVPSPALARITEGEGSGVEAAGGSTRPAEWAGLAIGPCREQKRREEKRGIKAGQALALRGKWRRLTCEGEASTRSRRKAWVGGTGLAP